MKVVVAKSAGFCFGVKRAVDQVYQVLEEEQKGANRKVYTYGPIIHNEEVVKDLESKGVEVLSGLEDLKRIHSGIVVIRSHGVGRTVYEILENSGAKLVDATCPFVKRIHNKVGEAGRRGEIVVIVGNPKHPEVEGICGWCEGPVFVINSEEDAAGLSFPMGKTVTVVSQTTYNYNKFYKLVEIIREKGYYINIANTICNATSDRQKEAREIAKQVDAMIVIGGRHSSNTQKLYEICRGECENTYYIQTLVDLDTSQLQSIDSIGITAGASTPNNIIEEVQTNVIRI